MTINQCGQISLGFYPDFYDEIKTDSSCKTRETFTVTFEWDCGEKQLEVYGHKGCCGYLEINLNDGEPVCFPTHKKIQVSVYYKSELVCTLNLLIYPNEKENCKPCGS